MFTIWLRIDPNASWEKLIDALIKMSYYCLAQSVKKTYADVCAAQKKQGMLNPFRLWLERSVTAFLTNTLCMYFLTDVVTLRGSPKPKGILKNQLQCDSPQPKKKTHRVQWPWNKSRPKSGTFIWKVWYFKILVLWHQYSHALSLDASRQTTESDGDNIDTNIFVVKFSSLSEPKPVHTGDPVICSNQACTAVLNHLSYQYIREESKKSKKVTVW